MKKMSSNKEKQTIESDLHLNPHSKTYDNKQPLVKLTNERKKSVQKTQIDMHSKMKSKKYIFIYTDALPCNEENLRSFGYQF